MIKKKKKKKVKMTGAAEMREEMCNVGVNCDFCAPMGKFMRTGETRSGNSDIPR